MSVVTRFAPSPTGHLHVGGVRSALINMIYARQHGGKYVLRIEDTDKERSKPEFTESILKSFELLGINHDELIIQSENVSDHTEALEKLIAENKAYVSEEESGESKSVIRFRNPGAQVIFTDLIRGEVSVDTTDLGDFVIAKDMKTPLFHLAVVVDDNSAGITHVIRAEEHISNTPRHILIQEALGYERPTYAHMSLLLAEDRSKLSKRHGAVSIPDLTAEGYLPEALVNFLILLGWSPQASLGSDASEILSLEEILKIFKIEEMQKGGAIFSYEKLDWINKQYLERLSADEQLAGVLPYFTGRNEEIVRKLLPLVVERISKWSDLKSASEIGEWDFAFESPQLSPDLLVGKSKAELPEIAGYLEKVSELLSNVSDWQAEAIKEAIWEYASKEGRGKVLWPTRVALSGLEKSPDPFSIAELLGSEETLKRLAHAKEVATNN